MYFSVRIDHKTRESPNDSTVDMMEAGTTDQCLNTQEGAIEGRMRKREKSLQHIPHKTLTSCLRVLLSSQEEEEDEALTHTPLIM